MLTATIVENTITIAEASVLPNGVKIVEIFYDGTYMEFANAPSCIKFNDVLYGKSAHNSDTRRIVYRSDKPVTVKV